MSQAQLGDRRASPRLRVFFGGRIPGNDLRPEIDCNVRSLSRLGARLSPTTMRGLPPRFELSIDSRKRVYLAEVVWRRDGDFGVRFKEEGCDTVSDFKDRNGRLSVLQLRKGFCFAEQQWDDTPQNESDN